MDKQFRPTETKFLVTFSIESSETRFFPVEKKADRATAHESLGPAVSAASFSSPAQGTASEAFKIQLN